MSDREPKQSTTPKQINIRACREVRDRWDRLFLELRDGRLFYRGDDLSRHVLMNCVILHLADLGAERVKALVQPYVEQVDAMMRQEQEQRTKPAGNRAAHGVSPETGKPPNGRHRKDRGQPR
jgi:hypothetical protein